MLRGRFADRADAGRHLAEALRAYEGDTNAIVLALVRGGVPVAYEVARALGLPLDVMIVRKLGMPGQEEYAIGAIASGGVRVMNEDAPLHLASAEEMAGIVAQETAELERRERVYRGERPQPDLHGRTVILVDDGLATGSSMRAAIAAARQRGAGRVVVAVPVGPEHTRAAIRAEADDVICVLCPEIFYSVGEWYRHFDQTSDDDVTRLLDAAWTRGV